MVADAPALSRNGPNHISQCADIPASLTSLHPCGAASVAAFGRGRRPRRYAPGDRQPRRHDRHPGVAAAAAPMIPQWSRAQPMGIPTWVRGLVSV